jgi:hypothetical protein
MTADTARARWYAAWKAAVGAGHLVALHEAAGQHDAVLSAARMQLETAAAAERAAWAAWGALDPTYGGAAPARVREVPA